MTADRGLPRQSGSIQVRELFGVRVTAVNNAVVVDAADRLTMDVPVNNPLDMTVRAGDQSGPGVPPATEPAGGAGQEGQLSGVPPLEARGDLVGGGGPLSTRRGRTRRGRTRRGRAKPRTRRREGLPGSVAPSAGAVAATASSSSAGLSVRETTAVRRCSARARRAASRCSFPQYLTGDPVSRDTGTVASQPGYWQVASRGDFITPLFAAAPSDRQRLRIGQLFAIVV